MEFKKAEMFWDGANGKYTSDDSYCPVYRGETEGIYIETWNSANNTTDRLGFAFTQTEKDNGLVYHLREEHFKRHSFRAFHVIRMILPPGFYDEMYERFIR